MQVIQIRREAEPFNGAFDVLLDVGGGIREFAVAVYAVEAAF